jgi:hypothetical protein
MQPQRYVRFRWFLRRRFLRLRSANNVSGPQAKKTEKKRDDQENGEGDLPFS